MSTFNTTNELVVVHQRFCTVILNKIFYFFNVCSIL